MRPPRSARFAAPEKPSVHADTPPWRSIVGRRTQGAALFSFTPIWGTWTTLRGVRAL
ncbi:hypothetical protein COLSTE_01860 [Collinsella stercoris DSM 13279]|uniref:Uncharacterized protein n=1 Tax=Collinsella stercoris DSM 13279 TaxID=445975 RepID=B6GCN6_9ACTN|nr:hypothetical protein COLSTE_01860 [Collinsella stercoris DSM 13279]